MTTAPRRFALARGFLFGAILGLSSLVHGLESQRILVSVPGPGAANFLPVQLMSRTGADKAEGVEVKVVFSPSGASALEELATNNVDFAVVGLPSAMSMHLRDPRIVALAAVNDLPLYVLMVRQGLKGQVRQISDLKGRAIGLHSDSMATKTTSHQVLELMLRRGGVPANSYRKVTIGRRWESESAMLKNGEVDALVGDEPYASRMADEKIAYPLVHLGDPEAMRQIAGGGFLRAALIGRRDKIDKDPAKVEKMVRVLQRTLAWIAGHKPEEVVALADVADEQDRKYLTRILAKFPRQFSTDGKFSARQLKETEIFFMDSQQGNPQAESLRLESMVIDRWAGRKE